MNIETTIETHLEGCNGNGNMPYICSQLSTPESKREIINHIMAYMQKGKTISEAIVQIERDYNPNMADNPY